MFALEIKGFTRDSITDQIRKFEPMLQLRLRKQKYINDDGELDVISSPASSVTTLKL